MLPADVPERFICCPTRGRWKNPGAKAPGDLGRWVHSVMVRLEDEDLADSSWIVIGDQTADCPLEAKAANVTWGLAHPEEPIGRRPEVFLQDAETRAMVAREVGARLRPPERIIENFFMLSGYAQSRISTEFPLEGYVLMMDDDTSVPSSVPVVVESGPGDPGFQWNSQILHSPGRLREIRDRLEVWPNRIGPLFEPLGRTVGELRRSGYGPVRATDRRRNTMHAAFDESFRTGASMRFVISHDDTPDFADAGDAEIVAIVASEHGIPDFRTIRLAEATIRNGGAPFDYETLPAGDTELFAFRGSDTHISSVIGRDFRSGLDRFPWWFLTDDSVSRRNPYRTVRTSYRSDNELVAGLLRPLSRSLGRDFVYGQGVAARVLHRPATTGHRPALQEQAAASLVGALIATEVLRHIAFDSNGVARLPEIPESYRLPDAGADMVFERMSSLAVRCRSLAEAPATTPEVSAWCGGMYDDIRSRLANFDFPRFKSALDEEARDQLRFFQEVLDWYPRVRQFVIEEMVRRGRYPVRRFVD